MHSCRRSLKFITIFINIVTRIAAISRCMASFTSGIVPGLSWCALDSRCPHKKKSQGVRSGERGGYECHHSQISSVLPMLRGWYSLKHSLYEQWLHRVEIRHVEYHIHFPPSKEEEKPWSIATYHSEFTVTVCPCSSSKQK